MKSIMRKPAMKLGILVFMVAALVVGMALPGLADTPAAAPSIHTLQGKVLTVGAASFSVQAGATFNATISVDGNTNYYIIPMGKVATAVSNQVNKDLRQDKGKQTKAGAMKELHIPANWRSDVGWLATFDKKAQFSDVEVGDRVIARVDANNLAKNVLIVKAPVIRSVKGQISLISAVAPGSITITPVAATVSAATANAAVTVGWDANTHFTLKGLTSVQAGQYAVMVYNSKTNLAITVAVQPTAPAPAAAH